MKISFSKKILIKRMSFLVLIFVMAISGCVQTQNPKQLEFAGQLINFRADLLEAAKVNVYPNESILKEVLLSPDVAKIHIAFIPNETENAYYAADSFELAYKLTIINKFYKGFVIKVESLPVNSTSELLATKEEPIILLSVSNRTAVTVKDNLIVCEGKDLAEIGRDYTDLDLAVDKLLLVLMKDN